MYFTTGNVRPLAPPTEAPILVTISEPRIQIVEVGKTVTFNCDAMPRFRIQVMCVLLK
jgi:hypothetical protein